MKNAKNNQAESTATKTSKAGKTVAKAVKELKKAVEAPKTEKSTKATKTTANEPKTEKGTPAPKVAKPKTVKAAKQAPAVQPVAAESIAFGAAMPITPRVDADYLQSVAEALQDADQNGVVEPEIILDADYVAEQQAAQSDESEPGDAGEPVASEQTEPGADVAGETEFAFRIPKDGADVEIEPVNAGHIQSNLIELADGKTRQKTIENKTWFYAKTRDLLETYANRNAPKQTTADKPKADKPAKQTALTLVKKSAPVESLALAGDENIIDAEFVDVLSEQENARRIELETAIKETQKQAGFIIGAALDEIKTARLYRSDFKTFEDYIGEKFGFAREYGYQLINAARSFKAISAGNETQGAGDAPSIRAMLALDSQIKQIAVAAGLDKKDAGAFGTQIGRLVWETIEQSAPVDDKTGKPLITFQHVVNTGEVIKDFIAQQAIEIGGVQIPLEQARETIGSTAFKAHVTQTTFEQIQSQKGVIAEEVKKKRERLNEPQSRKITGGGANFADSLNGSTLPGEMPAPEADASKQAGAQIETVPTVQIICSLHGQQNLSAVIHAGIALECGCKFRHIEGREGLICTEVDGRELLQTAPVVNRAA